MKNKNYILLVGILAAHLALLIKLKFTAWPEMLIWPYLMIKGWLPYTDIAIAHTPLMLFDLSIIYKLFGVGVLPLKAFTWALIIFSDILVFWVFKKLWNFRIAFSALLAFIFLNLFFDGNGLWFDLYMGVLAFLSFYFSRKEKFFWAGVFWSLAFLSKQTAVWFLIPIAFDILRPPLKGNPLKVAASFAFGVILVLLPFLFLLFIFHIIPSFWDWAVKFGIFILPKSQGQTQFPDLKGLAKAAFPFLILIPLIIKRKKESWSLFLWSFAGCLGAFPRFEYFHFQPAIFYLSIEFGLVFTDFRKFNKILQLFFVVFILVNGILFAGFLKKNFGQETRFYESDFSRVISFVKEKTSPGDYIFVLNWWDSLYALTDTIPATKPLVPQLAWYQEINGVQKKEVEDISFLKPKIVIFNPYTNTGLSSYIPRELYNYIDKNYVETMRIGNIKVLTLK